MPSVDELARRHAELHERLPMWTIYDQYTLDYPGKWVLRMHLSIPKPEVTDLIVLGDTLEEVRAALPPGLTRLDRHPMDVPQIREIWL